MSGRVLVDAVVETGRRPEPATTGGDFHRGDARSIRAGIAGDRGSVPLQGRAGSVARRLFENVRATVGPGAGSAPPPMRKGGIVIHEEGIPRDLIVAMRDLVTDPGKTYEEVERAFHDSMEDCLEFYKDQTMSVLHERCPICAGSGLREIPVFYGFRDDDARRGFLCPACRGEKFAPVGITLEQARRAVEDRDRLASEVAALKALAAKHAVDWDEVNETLREACAEIDRLEAAQPDPRGGGLHDG